MSLTLPIRDVIHSWAGYRALPSSPFETLALSSAAELVGVARPRCGGSVTRESDISNGENGDISIGRLHPPFRVRAITERRKKKRTIGATVVGSLGCALARLGPPPARWHQQRYT